MYFAGGSQNPTVFDQAELQNAIDAAKQAGVAIFPVAVPVATYEGQPEVTAALVDALNRESRYSGDPKPMDAIAGLLGRPASFELFAQKDRFSPKHQHGALVVPLAGFSGHVDVLGEILADNGAGDTPVNHVRDSLPASAGRFQADFMLDPATYVCHVIVREQESGRTYGETIRFEVK